MSKQSAADNDAPTDSGHRVGDPCEAIDAVFVFGPVTCGRTSVSVAVDAEWGTTHAVCAEHAPRVIPPAEG